MLIPDYTDRIVGLIWIIGTIYVAIAWVLRIFAYVKALRVASQHPREALLEGLVDPYRGSSPPTLPWYPSLGARVALLGLLLVPCLWGPVATFALVVGADWRDGVDGPSRLYLGCACVVPILITAWFCRRARRAFPDLGQNFGRSWRISAGGVLLTGGLLACLLGMTKSIEKVGRVSMACSYAVVGESVLLGLLLLYTSAEIAAAEKGTARRGRSDA